MSLRINSNIAAMNAYRNLSVNDKQMQGSLEKLSSGLRINRSADDAAGMSIAQGLQSQIGGLKVATRNAQDGVNVVQTADGALNESAEILQRMRDLAVQAANGGSQDTNAQAAAQTEFGQLQSELDRIAKTTSFGGQKLLAVGTAGGTAYTGSFQVGANNTTDDRINVSMDASVFGAAGTKASNTLAGTFSAALDTETITASIGGNGATVTLNSPSSLDDVVNQLNGNASFSASFVATKAGADLKISSKVAQTETITVSSSAAGLTAGTAVAGTTGSTATGFDSAGLGVGNTVSLNNTTNARNAIDAVDAAIKNLSTARSQLGAYQNRFEHTINNINVQVENLSASKSAITDTDMAQEMVKFTRSQILSQAGTAMLAQANQAPQSVLQLLRG
ncbi:flagellin [Actinokineospora globicatena]|uniref:flagellin N-terminal helical domain-containing protein n=1 Tax=Actinokineospora globicatena TaxID=103729 RepID=UPI0020A4C4E2|nr:flagellin [Actinokineospora globicatena]MCP2306234.1 flagellin [Actinokineospora globicatena]GLW81660.1 flagellin [Actinokineospora globicatena]GLW88454.1 flagellin [Actinokineospora globicatena]